MNMRSVHGTWPPGEKRHINALEMTAVLHSCLSFLEQIRDKDVMIFPDNSTVVAYVNHQGGTKSINTSRGAPSAPFCSQCKDTMPAHCGCTQHSGRSPVEDGEHPDLDRVVSVTRTRSSNGRLFRDTPELQADYLRVSIPRPIGIEGRHFKHVLGRSGCLRIPSHQSAEASSNTKVATHNCRILLLAPFWPKQSWFAEVQNLLYSPPWALPLHPKLLRLPQSQIFHKNRWVFNLHVWPLLSKPT